MRELGIRILKRTLPIVVVLGVMGYIFAEIYLMLIKMNGGVQDHANDSVRWRTPLSMAAMGVGIFAFLELISFSIRSKRPKAPATGSPDNPKSGSAAS